MAILQVEDIVRTCARFEQLGAKPVFGTQLLAAAEVGEGGRGERASRYTPGSALPKAPGTVRHVFAATRRGGGRALAEYKRESLYQTTHDYGTIIGFVLHGCFRGHGTRWEMRPPSPRNAVVQRLAW